MELTVEDCPYPWPEDDEGYVLGDELDDWQRSRQDWLEAKRSSARFRRESAQGVAYFIISGKYTYVGAAKDLDRRLKQHNGKISGGARYTTAVAKRGTGWEPVCHIQGFPSWQAVLQFEWKWKQLWQATPAKHSSVKRRMEALKQLLALERSTDKAVPFAQWEFEPRIVWYEAALESQILSEFRA